ncbi:hypothetical protein DL93DRAFT_2229395 [Clavulina sp. PMI_390]|nr:hypothetical protein DL93DRAFT_2229395 [Clavulina sp. PMI_390]
MIQKTTIALFGLEKLQADMVSYEGPVNDRVVTRGGPPAFDVVVLKQSLRLSTLIPDLEGTTFNQLMLQDVVLSRQNFSMPGGRSVGLHFNGVLTIDKTSGDLHALISDVLGCKDPRLELYCGLGYVDSWAQRPRISSFTLQGTLPNISIGDKFKLTSIGLKIYAFETSAVSARGTMDKLKMGVGFGVFGTMSISVHSWDHPIEVEFAIEKMASLIELSTTAHLEWKNAFGVSGLTLNDVSLGATIDLDQPLSRQTFEIGASFTFGKTKVSLDGSFSLGGEFTLEAEVQELTWGDIELLYYELFQEKLPHPPFDVKLRRGTLVISSTGFSLSVDHLEIGDYPPTSGTIALHSTGIQVKAAVDGDALDVGDFSISKPQLGLTSSRANGKAALDLIISGNINWNGFTISVSAHVYPSPDGDGKHEHTICGAFVLDDPNAGLRFDRLIEELEGTGFGRVTLDGAAIVYASHEKAVLPETMKIPYEVRKGFYICAKIGHLDAIAPFFDGSPNLFLSAQWSSGNGFLVSIQANDLAIDFGDDDFISEPLKFDLVLGSSPIIRASCGLKLMLKGQEPLIFRLAASLQPAGGELDLSASMLEMWTNPFGISPHLQIGNLKLTFKLVGGAPKAIIVAGKVKIKDSSIDAVFGKGATPDQTFVKLHLENIGPKKMVDIAKVILNFDLPEPPEVYSFQVADLYVCPHNIQIDGQPYNRGMSFRADMTLFGKKVMAHVELSDAGFLIEGEVEPFSIGPLAISGTTGNAALLRLHIFKDRQSGKFDGSLSLGKILKAEVYCSFSLQPRLSFDFSFKIAMFGELLVINVFARSLRPLEASSCDISQQRYWLHADFEQHLISHIRDSIYQSLKQCAEGLQAKADSAKRWVDETQQKFSAALDHVRQCGDDWKSGDERRRSEFLEQLQILIKTHVGIHPQDIPPNSVSGLQAVFDRYRAAQTRYEEVSASRKEEIERRNIFKHLPLPLLPTLHIVGGALVKIGSAVEGAVDDSIRGPMKAAELEFLRSQKAAVDLVINLLPSEARGPLWAMAKEISDNLAREEHNDRLDDFLEDLRDIAMESIIEILNFVLQLVEIISKVVAGVAKGAITLGNGIGQGVLKFAQGAVMAVFSALDIQSIVIDAEIGAGDKALKFHAAIRGVLNGAAFYFETNLELGSPDAFKQLILDGLKEKLTKLVS